MSKRKKLFSCGHRGYGQVCHRCSQKKLTLQEKRERKNAWEASFSDDPIDLKNLPKNVVIKARRIIKALEKQQSYCQFRGKRLRHDRFIISIPVTRHYRLICQDNGSFVTPKAVISHENYNVCKPGK